MAYNEYFFILMIIICICGVKINTRKNNEAFILQASKEVGLEVNIPNYIYISILQKANSATKS